MGYCRKPKTTNELRANCGYEVDREQEEYDLPLLRERRRKLPTWYDDLIAIPQKSWKSHRKTQWKQKKENKIKKYSKFRGHINPRKLRQRTKQMWCKHYIYNYDYDWKTGHMKTEIVGYNWKWHCNVVEYYEGSSEKEYYYEQATDKDYK